VLSEGMKMPPPPPEGAGAGAGDGGGGDGAGGGVGVGEGEGVGGGESPRRAKVENEVVGQVTVFSVVSTVHESGLHSVPVHLYSLRVLSSIFVRVWGS